MNERLVAALEPLLSRVRTDVSWIKRDGKQARTNEPITPERIARHLNGGPARGVAPMRPGQSVTCVGLLDFDSHKGETPWPDMRAAAQRVVTALRAAGGEPVAFRSSGGHGIHLYLLWDAPQDAYSVREWLEHALEAAGLRKGPGGVRAGEVEVFPKQNEIAEGRFGNQFILPLAGQSVPLDPFDLDVLPRDWIDGVDWPMSRPVPLLERPAPASHVVADTPDLAEIRAAAAAIPSNSLRLTQYMPWLDIIHAIHAGTGGSEDGRAIAHEWGQRSPIYDPDELDEKWDYARLRDDGITVETLFKAAREEGDWVGPRPRTDDFEVIAEVATTKARAWAVPAPIDPDEWTGAQLSPPCIVEGYLYADVALLVAPGGTGKTTLLLYEAVHIVLGLPLWGRQVRKPGPVLIITGEDSREVLVARLREIALRLDIEGAQLQQVMRDVLISDLSGGGWKLSQVRNDVVLPSELADQIVRAMKDRPPVLVTLDPAVSFGVGEGRVNDAEQGLIDAGRRIRAGLQCCVRYVHHTGKQVALDRREDQYAGRGGSAFADGARMVTVMHSYRGRELLEAKTWTKRTRTTLAADEIGIQLTLAKLSYAAPQPPIYVARRGPADFRVVEVEDVQETAQVENDRAQQAVLDQVRADVEAGKFPSSRTLESMAELMDLTRRQVRDSVNLLLHSGALEEADIDPPPERGRRKFLRATENGLS